MASISVREPTFWSCNSDDETLSCNTIVEAVGQYLDNFEAGDVIPETLTVYGYARMQPGVIRGRALEYVLELLDEELGDPNGEFDSGTSEAMLAAEDAFLHVVEAEYQSWACELVETRTVRVADYLNPEVA